MPVRTLGCNDEDGISVGADEYTKVGFFGKSSQKLGFVKEATDTSTTLRKDLSKVVNILVDYGLLDETSRQTIPK